MLQINRQVPALHATYTHTHTHTHTRARARARAIYNAQDKCTSKCVGVDSLEGTRGTDGRIEREGEIVGERDEGADREPNGC